MTDKLALMRDYDGIFSSQLEVVLCYDIEAPVAMVLDSVLRTGLGFEPVTMVGEFSNDEEVYDEKLLRRESFASFEVYGPNSSAESAGARFGLATIPAWGFKSLYWSGIDVSDLLVDSLAVQPGFTFGYKDDLELTELHSIELHQHLASRGVSLDPSHLAVDEYGRSLVPLDLRPARRTLFPRMWLKAGWKMWTSPYADSLFFSDPAIDPVGNFSIRSLDNGGRAICLHPADSESAVAYSQRRKFRGLANMDWLESHSVDFLEGASDPVSVFSRVGDGAVVTTYLDNDLKACRRSCAVYFRTVTLDKQGAMVKSDIERLVS